MVLAIGLVVDDSIVVLENIYRRIEQGEHPLLASYNGSREVGFAVVATTLVLISVFVPLVFMQGDLGKLFTEFALAVAAAVAFSAVAALTLTPMLCSKMLKQDKKESGFSEFVHQFFIRIEHGYRAQLQHATRQKWPTLLLLLLCFIASGYLLKLLPSGTGSGRRPGNLFCHDESGRRCQL